MGTKINHERFLQSNRVMDSRKSGYAHRKEIERLENTITMKQRKYHGFLAKLCDENGIPPSKMGITSKECSTAINTMKQRLADAGVKYEDKARCDELNNAIADIINAPTIIEAED